MPIHDDLFGSKVTADPDDCAAVVRAAENVTVRLFGTLT